MVLAIVRLALVAFPSSPCIKPWLAVPDGESAGLGALLGANAGACPAY